MLGDFVSSLYAAGGIPVIVLGIIAIALGALESFLGYRIFKVQVAIIAFLVGLFLGGSVIGQYTRSWLIALLLGILLGAVLAWVSIAVYKVGVFLVVGAFAFLVSLPYLPYWWIALMIGIAAGLLGVFLTKPVIIAATAFGGGSIIAGGLSILIWNDPKAGPMWLRIAVALVFGVAGMIVQFRTTRKLE